MSEAHRGHLAMLAFSLLIAGSFSLGRIVAYDIAPIALNASRFAIAAVVVASLGVLTGTMTRADFVAPWRFVLLGGLFSSYFVLMFEALKYAEPVNTAVVFTLTPVMAAGFGWLLLRQRTTPLMALALAIGAAGAIWVVFRGDLGALMRFDIGRGELIFFVGAVAHALYIPLARMLNRGASPFGYTLGVLLAGTAVQAVLGAEAILETDWLALPRVVWVTILYTSIFASASTFVLIYYATLRLPAAKVMAYTYLTPSWVLLWEIGLGNPVPPVVVLGGVALTALSLVVLLLAPDGDMRRTT
ncbi:DMT family transporter [Pseudaestuariivita sp.]|uniref:DMT family transporter n=1 Tax=Pseudaestuariivita sp. TaxID=2211669 RepID=UPI004059518A